MPGHRYDVALKGSRATFLHRDHIILGRELPILARKCAQKWPVGRASVLREFIGFVLVPLGGSAGSCSPRCVGSASRPRCFSSRRETQSRSEERRVGKE